MDINIIVAFIVGWIIGHKLCSALNHLTFREILKDLGITNQQLVELAKTKGMDLTAPEEPQPELAQLEIRIEEHQGMLLAYRKDTEEFLGQGTDREALIRRVTENLTNVRVIVAKEDGADFLQKG